MATKSKSKPARSGGKKKAKPRPGLFRRVRRFVLRALVIVLASVALLLLALRFVDPRITLYMYAEDRRLGGVDMQWVPLDEIAPVMARSAAAAEDANFCNHWGFDMAAIRAAIEDGANRGASTITQQTVKNLLLWQGRSWTRKALEALLTPTLEVMWPKRRIMEVYLNIIEFDEGVFGVDAAAHHYFRVGADKLTPLQAARLAAVLPNPKGRNAAQPTAYLKRRTAAIMDGAATLRADGRAACFGG